MKTLLDSGILAVTVILMVTVGLDLEAGSFLAILRRKGLLLSALLLPALLLPLLGWCLSRVMDLPPHLTAGILLFAACPVGDIANFYTLLAGGNLALSVTVNTLSCLLCTGTMAIAFELYDHLLGQPFEFALPTSALVLRLILMITLPVLAGMAVRRWKPAWAAAHRKMLRNLCLAGTGFLVVYVLFNRWSQVAADWRQTTLASLVFMTTAFAASLVLSRLMRLSAVDGITTGILFAVRNVAIAMAIAVTLLNRTEFAEVAVVYFLAEVPLLLGTVGVYRRWWAGLPTGART